MSATRKMARQIAKAQAQRLSQNGKNGKNSKIFKNIWKGQQIAQGKTTQRAKDKKVDKDIAHLLADARAKAAERAK